MVPMLHGQQSGVVPRSSCCRWVVEVCAFPGVLPPESAQQPAPLPVSRMHLVVHLDGSLTTELQPL